MTGRNEGQIPGEFTPEESAGGLAERARGSKSIRHGRVSPLGEAAGALRKGGVGNSEGGCSSSREWLGTERVSVRAGSDDIADNSNRPDSGDIGVADSTRRTVPNPLCALFYRSPYRALRCVHVVIILFFFFYTDDKTEGRRTEELEPVKIARPMGSRAGLTRAQSMLSDLSCVPRRVLFDPSLGNSGQRNQL